VTAEVIEEATVQSNEKEESIAFRRPLRAWLIGAATALLVYLCWRMVSPFLLALCWAFALAVVAHPLYNWLLQRGMPQAVGAVCIIVVTVVMAIGPGLLVVSALAREASDIVTRITVEPETVRRSIESNSLTGPAFRWLDERYDLPKEAMQVARSLAGWTSSAARKLLTGSMWLFGQVAVALFTLFYLLRDGPMMAARVKHLIPFPAKDVDFVLKRVAQTLRVSLAGKLIVAGIQGTLGGVIFGLLGLPGPVFWGCLMAALSVFPVVGAFVIWAPAAIALALHGHWWHALALTGWGILIIHPVDNLLGPVLVGSTLHFHTLLMFFCIVGGLAAFGASGIVVGPVILAIVTGLLQMDERANALRRIEP
jgi:predicted PurR-regulated permease PerM